MAIKIPRIRKKNSWKSKLAWAAAGLAVLAVIAFLADSNWRIYQNRQAMAEDIKKLQEQIQILDERRDTLTAGLNATQGDDFEEEKMRDQGYKKPGEQVIAVLQDKASNATNQDVNGGSNFWVNLWQKIKNIKP
jgi:cell division protein FtsB